jgi:hypothetical protein
MKHQLGKTTPNVTAKAAFSQVEASKADELLELTNQGKQEL